MEGVCPHVAACQRLVVGEDHGVVLGVGLMAALTNPAVVVRERVMEAPVTEGGPVAALGGLSGKGPGQHWVLSPPPVFPTAQRSGRGGRALLAPCSPTVGSPQALVSSASSPATPHTHTHTRRCPSQTPRGHSSWSHPVACPSGLAPATDAPARLCTATELESDAWPSCVRSPADPAQPASPPVPSFPRHPLASHRFPKATSSPALSASVFLSSVVPV